MCWITTTVLLASIHGLVAQEIEAKIRFSLAAGIGREKGIMRRDPSDLIKVDDLYYVWYTKGRVTRGYNRKLY